MSSEIGTLSLPRRALDEYGRFVASLAPWSHFLTLTHRSPDDAESPAWSRVGVARHRRDVREWFYDDVRRLDHSARWWSETEFHVSGVPHEHGVLAVRDVAPVLSMRQAWYERAGYAKVEAIRSSVAVAGYVAKYGGKSTSREPFVFGFGLLSRPSFAIASSVVASGERVTERRR